jgi:hypothetical protein
MESDAEYSRGQGIEMDRRGVEVAIHDPAAEAAKIHYRGAVVAQLAFVIFKGFGCVGVRVFAKAEAIRVRNGAEILVRDFD